MYTVKQKIADVIKTVLLFFVPNERYGFALVAAGQCGERANDVSVVGNES